MSSLSFISSKMIYRSFFPVFLKTTQDIQWPVFLSETLFVDMGRIESCRICAHLEAQFVYITLITFIPQSSSPNSTFDLIPRSIHRKILAAQNQGLCGLMKSSTRLIISVLLKTCSNSHGQLPRLAEEP